MNTSRAVAILIFLMTMCNFVFAMQVEPPITSLSQKSEHFLQHYSCCHNVEMALNKALPVMLHGKIERRIQSLQSGFEIESDLIKNGYGDTRLINDFFKYLASEYFLFYTENSQIADSFITKFITDHPQKAEDFRIILDGIKCGSGVCDFCVDLALLVVFHATLTGIVMFLTSGEGSH